MNYGIILDLSVIAIIVICAIMSAKRGFVRTVVELVGFIAAIFIAFTVSSPLAVMTYDKIIEPSIVSKIEEVSDEGSQAISNKLWDSFPGIVKNQAENFGLSEDRFDKKVTSSVSDTVSNTAEKISDNVTRPLITKILSMVYSTVISIVLIILSKFLAKVINRFFKVSFIGTINSFLGGIAGTVKGVALSVVFCLIISVLLMIAKNGVWIFNSDNIASSHLFKLFYGFSPFV